MKPEEKKDEETGLEKKLAKTWQRVRKAFFFPNLPDPELKDPLPNPAYLDLGSHRIFLSGGFVDKLVKTGLITDEDAMMGLLSHEVDHHVKCPYDFYTWLSLYASAREAAGDQNVAMLSLNYYLDAVVNTHITTEKGMDEVHKLLSALYSDAFAADPELAEALAASKKMNTVMAGLYQQVWNRSLNVTVGPEEQEYVDRLAVFDYLASQNREEDVARFTEIVQPILEEAQELAKQQQQQQKKGKKGKKQQGQGQGSGQPDDGQNQQGQPQDGQQSDPNGEMLKEGLMDKMDPDSFSENEIMDGLRDYADKVKDPKKISDLIEELGLDDRLNGEDKRKSVFPWVRASRDGLSASSVFYGQLARNYSVPVKKQQLHKDGSLYPYTLKKYQLGDDLQKLDPFNSQGKIIPGLSQRWVYKESETVGNKEGVPDAILCIDSSGSMANPKESLSYAVLGAVCAANAYLDNSASVSVINFSGLSKVLEYSQNRQKIHEAICEYQVGNTELDIEALDSLVSKAKDKVDIILISDLAISNIEHVIDQIGKHKQTHRVTVISIPPAANAFYASEMDFHFRSAERLREEFEGSDNIGFYRVEHVEDIPGIVLGETTRSFSR